MHGVRLLVTRAEPDGERTAAQLRARGHDVRLAPLLRVQAIDCEFADEAYAAVVMTSANAARAVAGHPRRAALTALPAFTVGRHTADAARAAGFTDVHSADGDKADLAALVRAQRQGRGAPLLYLAGADRAGELDLAAGGVAVVTAVVYRAVAAERFPPRSRPRSATARSMACCISPAAARRPISIAPSAPASPRRRWRRCSSASPAKCRRRSPPPAPPPSGSRRARTRPR